MKIDKKLIKELVDHLSEFNLTELEYQEGQTKIKVSKASKGIEQIKSAAVVSSNKAVLNKSDDSDGIRIKSYQGFMKIELGKLLKRCNFRIVGNMSVRCWVRYF